MYVIIIEKVGNLANARSIENFQVLFGCIGGWEDRHVDERIQYFLCNVGRDAAQFITNDMHFREKDDFTKTSNYHSRLHWKEC